MANAKDNSRIKMKKTILGLVLTICYYLFIQILESKEQKKSY